MILIGPSPRRADPVHWETWVICLAIWIAAAAATTFIYGKHLNGPVIRSDGFGYYAYLPSAFIDGDLSMRSAATHLPAGTSFDDYGISRDPVTGKYFDKYPMGTALLESPSFMVAHMLTGPLGYKSDGYSAPYQVANIASAIAWLLIGTVLVAASLRKALPDVRPWLTLVLIVFATNVFHYATYDGAFSHVYAYAMVALALYFALGYRAEQRSRQRLVCVAACGLACGMTTLVRNTDAIVILLPALFIISRAVKERNIARFALESVLCASMFAFALVPEFIYFHATTGHWFTNSYNNAASLHREGFNWTRPELWGFLFSVRKGLFFWSPISLVAVAGLGLLWRSNRLLTTAVCLVLIAQIYICASWYCWWFGGSFGSRPMVDMMPLLAIPLATVEGVIARRSRALAVITALPFVVVNMTFTYAYWMNIIPFDGTTWSIVRATPGRVFDPLLVFASSALSTHTEPVRFRMPGRVGLHITGLSVGDKRHLKVTLQVDNHADQQLDSWSDTNQPIRFSWRFVTPGSSIPLDQGWDTRADLTRDVAPHTSWHTTLAIKAPSSPGRYILQATMVQEYVAWFQDHGMPIAIADSMVIVGPDGSVSLAKRDSMN